MKRETKNFVFRNMVGLFLLIAFTFLTANSSLEAIGISEPKKKAISIETYQKEDTYKILEFLEKQMGEKKMSQKVRDKLFTLSGDQTRLISSLCERISDEEHSAVRDIAYLLVIALILLS